MEDLVVTQNQLMGAMNQLLVNFKKDGADRKTASYIKKRLDTLETYWQEFQTIHIRLLESKEQSHAYFQENCYERTLAYYNDTKALLNNYLLEITKEKPLLKPPTPFTMPRKLDNPGPSSSPVATLEGHSGASTPQQQTITFEFPPVSGSSRPPQFSSTGNNSKLDEMMRNQKSNFKAFFRTISNVNYTNMTENYELEDFLRTINLRWSTIDSLHWKIDSELQEENQEYEQTFTRYEQRYLEIKKEVTLKISSASHRERSTPQTEVPSFSGDYQKWMTFKDLYIEAIHSNGTMSNCQKMQFLKGKLKGEAEQIVSHLRITADNYQVCWDILNNRFNNTKFIFNSYMSIITNLPTLQQQSVTQLKKMHDCVIECLNSIKNMGVDISSWDPLVMFILEQKLDLETDKEYCQSLKNPRALPTIKDFTDFLESKFTSLEASQSQRFPNKSNNSKSSQQTDKLNQKSNNQYKANYNQKPMNNVVQKQQTGCQLCKKFHRIFNCKIFLNMKPLERRNTIAKLKLCMNCLYDHFGKKCLSNTRCRECNGRHNTLIHEAFSDEPSTENEQTEKNVTHVSQDDFTETLLATAMVKVKSADGTFIKLRALIDQGSQTSLITENAAQMLKLPRQRCKGVIFGVGAKENNCKGTLNIICSSLHNNYQFETDVYIMKQMVNNLPNHTFNKPTWSFLEGIQLADPDFNINRPVDLLLGADVYSCIILSGIISSEKSMPVAQQTRLGWVLCGNVKSFQCNVIINNVEDIQRFWEIEDIPHETSLSQEDAHCLEYFKNTTTRQTDGRYVVRLPMISDAREQLGESKPRAIAQLKQLEKRFIKNPDMQKGYESFVSEYITLNHMQIPKQSLKPLVYLPHHCVIKADSTTTALRVVFNASSKTSSGRSLNDVMYRGPNLQQDLLSLIIKWRQYKYAYTADIEKMFRNISVHEDDQCLQAVVWRNSASNSIKEYVLTTVTYGQKAAPFLAMMVLKQLAHDEGHKYQSSPAAKTLREQFYMDDLINGNHDIQSAKQLQSDLIQLLKSGGFNLRKWSSNTAELLQNVSTANSSDQYDFKHEATTKTFGLRWHAQSDELTFDLKINLSETVKHTKRSLLSDISKLFDPLGWLTPVTTKFKLLFQRIWFHNIEWDDELPADISNEWLKIRKDLKNISEIRIPRWLQICENDVIELHGFCDASNNAYACVIYCKIIKRDQYGNSNNSIVMVAAKSRLVPPKKDVDVSLPRLELSGTLLLSKLMEKVLSCLSGYNIKLFGWCDSMAVLGWLQGDPGRWKTFVANRVVQVTKILPPETWRYVKSSENPADCASRGITMEQVIHHPLWWHGPAWLLTFDEQKSKQQHFITNEEVKKPKQSYVTTTTSHQQDDVISTLLNNNSSWTRVTRILAYVLRFKQNDKSPFLTVTELKTARLRIIKHIQYIEFGKDIASLQQHNQVDSKSKLLCLNPRLDQAGLLRVGGRLRNASISIDMMHPLIIPHSGHVTNLLIDHAHKQTYHGGARVTLAKIRQQYWIIGGNRAVKMRLRQCITCRKNNPSKHDQILGNLPESRTNPSRPFYHTGVDFSGHVFVKSSKGRGMKSFKGYISLFICMATKAVHLELVSDMTTSAFLAALRRMAARRGTPSHMYSDNGTNFVGANKILKQEMQEIRDIINPEFLSEVSEMEITWHFNAPSNPSAGGLWEAAIKSVKYHLRRVIGEQKLTFEEYTTLLTQLEAVLNSRPLCALTEDPEDLNYLTPSHFLSSGPVLSIVETERDQRTRWHFTQKLFGDIWKRWQAEYLTQLTSRSKWLQPKENIKIDDIIIIHDANLPPGKWALGRVVDVHPGTDGYVRVVSVKTKNGIIKRPITKLSILPIENQSPEKASEQSKDNQTSPKRDRVKRTGSKLSNFILTMLLLFTMCAQNAYCTHNVSFFKEQQSLYFDKLSTMQLIRDEWKMVIYYDMNPYWEGSRLLSNYINHLHASCAKQKQRAQCDLIVLQLRHGLIELQYYDQLLLNKQSNVIGTRVRRGLVNGIGNIAHTLFGVLDDDFAQQYQRDIDLVIKNQNHLANLWKNQTSIIEAQYTFLKRLELSVDQQHKLFYQYKNDQAQKNDILKQEVESEIANNEFTLSSIIANNILSNLKQIQNTLLDTVTDIYHGKFNIHIISPDQIKEELNIISGHLSKDLSLPIENFHRGDGISKLYHLLRVKVRVTDHYMLLEVKIPLVTRENYDIYKIIPIPTMNRGKTITIIPITEHIAMNIQRDSYLPITEKDLQACYQLNPTTKLCEVQSPIYHMHSDQNLCVKDNTMERCQTITKTCQNNWIALNKLNNYLFYCCDKCTLRLMCGDQITFEHISKGGVLSMGSDCTLKADSFMIYSHNHHMNEMHAKPDLLSIDIPPVNNIINLTVPIDEGENRSDVLEETNIKDRQKSLNRIGQQIEQMKRSEIEQISNHDVHHYVVIYILVAVGCVAGVAFLWRRRRAGVRAGRGERAAAATAATAAAPAPQPAPRVSLSDITSASASASESANEPSVLSVKSVSSVDEKPRVVSVLYKNHKIQMIDKATTPTRVFPTFHANDLSSN